MRGLPLEFRHAPLKFRVAGPYPRRFLVIAQQFGILACGKAGARKVQRRVAEKVRGPQVLLIQPVRPEQHGPRFTIFAQLQ